ncbi:MAG: DNA polymerase I [Phycisphaerales bacterium]|nr:MAG: DNA polymerase I [Phycisphaerales bacterium]
MRKALYIIDGHAQIYRSYYARVPPLTSPSGEPTKATHVFCQSLLNLIRTRRPDYLAMALDVSDRTVFRCEIDAQYKANREPPPDDLPPQADRITSIVRAMGVPVFRKEGFEADDLMATIVERLSGRDLDIYLVSRDKDLDQLISDRVCLFDPLNDDVIDRARLADSKGFTPEQAIDVQVLTGDPTDNIPGVAGIGPKTAAKLVAKYGSAEAVVAHADELTPKQRQNVLAFAERMPITRQLVTLRRDVEFDFDLDACRFEGVPVAAVGSIFEELGFARLTEQLANLPGDLKVGDTPVPAKLDVVTEAVDYRLVDSVEGLDRLAVDLARQPAFAFDTETTGLNPVASDLVGLSLCWKPSQACYVPVRAAVGNTLALGRVIEKLGPSFADPAVRKAGQNVKFDLIALRQAGIEVAGVEFDTMIASALLDPTRRSHSLDALARELCGHSMIPIKELIGTGKKQVSIDQVDTARVCEYACEDADYTWRIKEILEPQMAGSPLRDLFGDTEMPLVRVLVDMECNGIALDAAVLARMDRMLAGRLKELTDAIHSAAGYPFNVDSPKQLAAVLFDEQGLKPVRKTKTGRSTDADTLEVLAGQYDNPIPGLVLEYRELAKLKGTYIDPLPGMIVPRTGRIHASFHQTGTITGRLSSSDPNLQNIPVRTEMGRRIREAFVAGRPDHVLLTADYSQIELRVLAHFCKDPTLMEAFRAGQDIHAFVAAQVNGVSPQEVTKEQRSAAKAVNFGIVYGQTPFGLARALGIPVGQARAFIDMYFMRYPGIRMFIDRTVAEAAGRGFVRTILGRRRYVPQLQSRNSQQRALGERMAVNTVIQGSAADLIKRAMVDIHREIQSGGHLSRMLIQVHDELVFETPADRVEAEADMIREKMTGALPLDVPVTVDIHWGVNWLEGK